MKLFEGKTPTERNKIIAAIVLGVTALLALTYTFSGLFFSSKHSVTVSVSPTPKPSSPTKSGDTQNTTLPTEVETNGLYISTPVIYNPNKFNAPDAGRNIFAFYEPPQPTPFIPPIKVEKQPTPFPVASPTPPPPLILGFLTPQSVYAGSRSFRLEVNGDRFTPDTVIYFNGSQFPTTFLSPQKLVADVPANFIANEGNIPILVRSNDGKLYSNQTTLTVQAPPSPQLTYIGMIARKRFNNDTAYFQEIGKDNEKPFGQRLNDVIGGRFRLISISAEEVILEDVSLGFKHKIALNRAVNGQGNAGGNQRGGGYQQPYNPNQPNYTIPQVNVPNVQNIQRPRPPQPNPAQQIEKKEVEEDGDN